VAGLIVWRAVGPRVRGFIRCTCLGSFAFVFYEFKRVSPVCLGDPHGCPRHILFQELKKLLLFFVYNLKGKIN
jgi:hypothetical protein